MITVDVEGRPVLMDAEDAELLRTRPWHVSKAGYVVRSEHPRKTYYLHRVILGAVKGQIVDHINGDKLDNRRTNLRICTHAENMRNSRRHKNNRSGYKGVWAYRDGRWDASIMHNRQYYWLGRHATAEEAARAYDVKALELHGGFARLNFPSDLLKAETMKK